MLSKLVKDFGQPLKDVYALLSVYGYPIVAPPVIDRLAAKGIRYTNAFTTAGVCSPSRTAIITGMLQPSNGARIWRREGGEFTLPYMVQLAATTHGASIVYTKETVEDSQWKLYSGPIRISKPTRIRAKSICYGYAEIEEITGWFDAD